MATLSEILNLNTSASSVKKIDLFLEQAQKYSYEYIKALCYKAIMLDELDETNDALKLVYSYVVDIDKMENRTIIALYDTIIYITTKCNRPDQALKYIELKKGYLPISLQSHYLKDKINLYLVLKDYDKAKELLKDFMNDDIDKEDSQFARENLAKIYFYERDFDNYLNLIPYLESYYKEHLMIDKLINISYNKLYIDFNLGRYTKVIFDGKDFMNQFKDDIRYNIMVSTLLIKSYLECNNTKQATILISNLEDIAGENYLDESIDFFYAAKACYAKLSNFDAISLFSKKIEELEKIKNPIKKEKKKEKKQHELLIKEKNDDVVIPVVEIKNQVVNNEIIDTPYNHSLLNPKKNEEIIQKQEIIKKITSQRSIEVTEEFKVIEGVLDGINNINVNLKFREIFRLSSIELSKKYKIDEIYLFYENKNLFGLHYKKERAYDKKLILDDIKNTINYQTYLQNVELFLDDNDRTYEINIVNNKEFDKGVFIITMPLTNEFGTIGSLSFLGYNQFYNEGLCYELLKMYTSLINTRLIIYLNQEKLMKENNRTFFLINNMNAGIKEEKDGYIELNDIASNILGSIPNLRVEDFFYNMDSLTIAEYRKLYEEISISLEVGKSFEYKYKKDLNNYVYVKETFYPEIIDGNLWITSLIEDITEEKEKEIELRKLAYKNPITNIFTEVKLLDDIKALKNEEKYSLAVIEVNDFNMFNELYGYNLQSQIIKAIGIELTDILSFKFKYYLYHLERDRFVILFKDIIDKRAITSMLDEMLIDVSKRIKKRNARLNIYFNCGCMRCGKNFDKSDPNLILGNALDALADAYNMDGLSNHIAHFNSELNKIRFKESERINAVSEAIDASKIALNYQQIVNLNDKSVFGFFAIPTHESYEIEYSLLESIARRKNLVKRFDKYIIELAFKEMKMIEAQKVKLPIFIRIHNDSLDQSFYNFVLDKINFYKVDYRYLTLVFDDAANQNVAEFSKIGISIASTNPLDLYLGYINFLFYDYHKYKIESAIDFNKLSRYKKCILIMNEINDDNDVNICIENKLNIVFGKKYKLLRRIDNLLSKIKS